MRSRYSSSQSAALAEIARSPQNLERRRAPPQLHAGVPEGGRDVRQHAGRYSAMNEQRLQRVTDAGPLSPWRSRRSPLAISAFADSST